MSLRWLLQKDIVASVVIGATSIKQLEDNIGASSGWMLTDEEVWYGLKSLSVYLKQSSSIMLVGF